MAAIFTGEMFIPCIFFDVWRTLVPYFVCWLKELNLHFDFEESRLKILDDCDLCPLDVPGKFKKIYALYDLEVLTVCKVGIILQILRLHAEVIASLHCRRL